MAAELVFGPEQLPPPERSGEEIGRHIDEILRRSEFREPPKSLYQRVVDFLNEMIGDALGAVLGGGRGTVVGLVLAVVLIAALVAIWVRFVPTISRDPGARGYAPDVDRPRRATDWAAEADAAAAAGRWRDALRCRYRALVAKLAEGGVIEEVPGRTAGEYRHELHRARPSAAPEFSRATALFELTWYGDVPAGTSDHNDFVEMSRRVLAEVRS